MATHSNILAWGIPWTEEPGGLSIGSQRVRHDRNNLACTPIQNMVTGKNKIRMARNFHVMQGQRPHAKFI